MSSYEFDHGAICQQIDLDRCAKGSVSRFRLQIVEDASGLPVCIPIIVMRGVHAGPTLGLAAAIHGDEINGIPVIHRILEKVSPKNLSGTIVAAPVLNWPAFHQQKRTFPNGVDLNTIMPGNENGNISDVYAAQICARFLPLLDYLIDLHTASRGRVNTLYARTDLDDERTSMMARLMQPEIIVHKPAMDGTIRGEASERGIPSVTLEVGNPLRFQPEYIRSTVRGVRRVMTHLGMLKTKAQNEERAAIECRSSYWIYTQKGGLLFVEPRLGERIKKDQHIATVKNIYGDVIEQCYAPEAGVVIGKSINPIGYSGSRVLHLGLVSA
jgi:predicted deacylase